MLAAVRRERKSFAAPPEWHRQKPHQPQRLPGSIKPNRPLQIQRQTQRRWRPAKAGRYKGKILILRTAET